MNEKNANLTESELAAVDSMIAYLQETNKDSMSKDFDSIFSNNTNCYQATPFVSISAVYAVSAPTGTCISGWIGTLAANAVNAVAAAAGGSLKSNESQDNSFFEKLSDGKEKLTLDELIAIRNQNR